MATDATPPQPQPQRAWRAACPNCGAPLEFRSAASAFAVCSFCRSTLLRDGDALRRIGASAELFDDRTPLQLGAAGRWQGSAFTLVGRLQLRYAGGAWNEWHALFDTGRSGWLSEDNGRCVMAFEAALDVPPPDLATLRPGAALRLAGDDWQVGAVVAATLGAAEGELPFAPALGAASTIVELRNARDEVGSLERDGDGGALRWSVGRSATLAALAMTGLAAGASEKTLGARALACPRCGAALEPKLTSTQSIVCGQCRAVVDVSQGAGADLAHYAQEQPHIDGGEPQIALGTTGALALGGAPRPWQVVGYVERAEVAESDDDEQTYWREYLLYNREEGFAFLVDAEDGWSWTRPLTGAPQGRGATVRWRGVTYRRLYGYRGRVTWVLGEFYWRLERGEETANTDYVGSGRDARKRLNREETAGEVVWSAGETLDADAVATAFRVPEARRAALGRDALPLAAAGLSGIAGGLRRALIVFAVVAFVIAALARCGRDDCEPLRQRYGESSNEYQQCQRSAGSSGSRSVGGSWGGYSSGGSHK